MRDTIGIFSHNWSIFVRYAKPRDIPVSTATCPKVTITGPGWNQRSEPGKPRAAATRKTSGGRTEHGLRARPALGFHVKAAARLLLENKVNCAGIKSGKAEWPSRLVWAVVFIELEPHPDSLESASNTCTTCLKWLTQQGTDTSEDHLSLRSIL